ncbi:MAG TPA: SusC/RagA family TonB-linked outer membrane protein, partial [Longimicrobiales bacterium]
VGGAVVRIPSLERETVTNDYGQYRFVIAAEDVPSQPVTLEVSSIGYSSATVTVTLRPGTIRQNITITEQAIALDEVVVTGTVGRQERRAQAAVVSTIDATRIAQVAPITSVANLLQARTPGVMLRNESGSTGTSQQIRIRGIASMDGSSTPLIFIDGVRMDGGDRLGGVGNQASSALNDIKIEDIESMEIVKGPAAATLYGADAAAGVINIITKKGRVGSGFTQTINVEYGQADPNFTPPDNFARCTAFALARPTTYPACVGQPEGTVLRDNPLQREGSFLDGRYRNLNYQLNGGGEQYSVFFSLGVDDDEGTLPNNEFGHINSRANFNFFARENLRLELGFGLSRTKAALPQNDNNIYGFLGGGFLGDPRTVGDGRKDGWYAQRQTLAIGSIETSDKTMRFQPRFSVTYTPFEWFTNRLMVGADMQRTEEHQFWAKNDDGWWDNAAWNTGRVEEDRDNEDRYTFDYSGTVTRNVLENLRADLSFGAQAIASRFDRVSVDGHGLVTNETRSVSAAAELVGGGQSSSKDRDIGILGRLQLSYNDRLYLTAGLRRDQSDAFGVESEPFYSPSVGASYVISDEPFFQNAFGFLPGGALTSLRLRAAWGVSGRHPSGGARSTYEPATNQISPSQIAIGVRPDDVGNPLLRAEKSTELELGFDAGFINERLGVEFTYFHKRLSDQIENVPIPPSLGSSAPDQNIGEMRNKGIELAANARVLTMENVALDLRGTVNTLSNKILDLGDIPQSRTFKVGVPLTGVWDYEIHQIDRTNASGKCPASATNGCVVVSDSLELVGNSINYPGWEAGFSSTLTLFQHLSFYTQFDARGDVIVNDATNEFRDRQFGQGEAAVVGAAAFGTDANGNPTEAAWREYLGRFGPFVTEDGRTLNRNNVEGFYNQDGGFVRLREAAVTFTIPSSFVQQYMKARQATLGLSMRNVRTWTDYSGLDPESLQFLAVPANRRWTLRFLFSF